MDETLFRSELSTQLGAFQLAVDGKGVLIEIWLPQRRDAIPPQAPIPRAAAGALRAAEAQLGEYLAGKRRAFDLRFEARGTPFEREVWAKLYTIPYGTTTSYGAIATALGLANGARAVGSANGANPIPVVIPCHRVIGADGQLTGYGGGLPLKRKLLELEGAMYPPAPRLL